MSFESGIFTFVFLFLLWLPLTAQAQYRFESWTSDNGLPQNGVRGIGQTRIPGTCTFAMINSSQYLPRNFPIGDGSIAALPAPVWTYYVGNLYQHALGRTPSVAELADA